MPSILCRIVLLFCVIAGAAVPVHAAEPEPKSDARPSDPDRRDPDALPRGAVFRSGTTQLKHSGGVEKLAFSRRGTYLASVGGDGMKLWRREDGGLVYRLYPKKTAYSVAIDDGERFLAVGLMGEVALHELRSGKHIATLTGLNSWVRYLCFATGGRHLAGASTSPIDVAVWDLETHKTMLVSSDPAKQLTTRGGIAFFPTQVSENRATALFQHEDLLSSRVARLVCDAKQQKLEDYGKLEKCQDIAVNAEGSKVFITGSEGKTFLFDARTGKRLTDLPVHGDRLTVNADGSVFALGRYNGQISVHASETGKELGRMNVVGSVNCLVLSSDGKYLAAGNQLGIIRVWEVASRKQILPTGDVMYECRGPEVAFRDRHTLVSACPVAGRVYHTDLRAKKVTIVQASEVGLWQLSATGKVLGVCTDDDLSRFDAITGRRLERRRAFFGGAGGCWISEDGASIAVTRGSSAALWEPGAREPVHSFKFDQEVMCVAYSPDGRRLALGGYHGAVYFLDIRPGGRSGEVLVTPDRSEGVDSLAFLGDNDTVLAVHYSGLSVLDLKANKIVKRFEQPPGNVPRIIKATRSGLLVAVAAHRNGKTVELWEVLAGKKIAEVVAHEGGVRGLAWSPRGDRFATGGADHTVLVWDVDVVLGLKHEKAAGPADGHTAAALWKELGSEDARVGFRAARQCVAFGDSLVPHLGERVTQMAAKKGGESPRDPPPPAEARAGEFACLRAIAALEMIATGRAVAELRKLSGLGEGRVAREAKAAVQRCGQ